MCDKVYVLTSSYNDYNQHGSYFLSVFKDKPSILKLIDYGLSEQEASFVLETGGGRRWAEDVWYYLEEHSV